MTLPDQMTITRACLAALIWRLERIGIGRVVITQALAGALERREEKGLDR